MRDKIKGMRTEILLFMILISAVALGNGLSDAVYSNYFKEVYQVTAFQRGFIEFPRELPGMLCVLVIGILSFLGDVRIALIAQVLAAIGVTLLGLLTPTFGLMLVFLFINSMGMHLFMPLSDSIGMSLAEPEQIGKRMGQFSSMRAVFGLIAALLVFFGFRYGMFSFDTKIKWVFLISAAAFLCAIVMAAIMVDKVKPKKSGRKMKLVFRKQYKYYYFLTVLKGVQKQIAFVYGTWVIVDLLLKKADTLALLTIIVTFISIFFLSKLGKWMDRFGIKRMMFLDALTFIIIYIIYGFVVWGIVEGIVPDHGWSVLFVYVLYISDRLSMQIGMVNSIYLKSIAIDPEEVTAALSTGISLDHLVSISAALAGGVIWANWGSQWVFFLAAAFSLGNLYVAIRVQPEKEKAAAELLREQLKLNKN